MRIGPYDLHNLSRVNTLPGEPSEFDQAVVYDLRQPERATLPKRWPVFTGTITAAHAWISARTQSQDEALYDVE